jgi:hypothetical protein
MITGLEREGQAFPEEHDVRVEGCCVFKINERIACKHESLDNAVMRYFTYEDRSPEREQPLYLSYNFPSVTPCILMLQYDSADCKAM